MTPIRWFASKTIWLQIVGLVITLGNIALTQLPGLGLDARPMLWWTLGLTAFVNIATWYLRAAPNEPAPPVGTKAEVEATK
ncbi:MAG: hypothetical protein JWR51_4690 [Devosia sp.]|uniref:hypothetical protein n=1 Tax=Devosia sp. TaxID=1871048 RepID=UPI00260FA5D2|nr:hypothetical protein [Devosia sp.]MDB5531587.1 hypothetical protein [Devosia sp.]